MTIKETEKIMRRINKYPLVTLKGKSAFIEAKTEFGKKLLKKWGLKEGLTRKKKFLATAKLGGAYLLPEDPNKVRKILGLPLIKKLATIKKKAKKCG